MATYKIDKASGEKVKGDDHCGYPSGDYPSLSGAGKAG